VVLVGTIAVAAPRLAQAPRRGTGPDPVPAQLALAASMEQQGRYGAAAAVYRTALGHRPTDDDLKLRLAFTLLRAGSAGEAEQLANQVLAGHADAPDAVLVLGLAQRESGARAASATLRRFLALAPQHPAAAEIRRLLDAPGNPP
jgi:uncharacterized protein HemY